MTAPTKSNDSGAMQARMAAVMSAYVRSLMDAHDDGADPSPALRHEFPSFDYFCAEQEPRVSVERYAGRLTRYMHCTPEVFIYAMAYLRRLHLRGCPINSRSVHRLLLCATVVGAKMRDDYYWSMKYYAQVGGVTTEDLNGMEVRFLSHLLDFRAEVLPEEYRAVLQCITAIVEPGKGQRKSAASLSESTCGVSRSTTPTEDFLGPTNAADSRSVPTWAVDCAVFW